MKIAYAQTERTLGEIGREGTVWRVLFLHGEDSGLIRERARNAAIRVLGQDISGGRDSGQGPKSRNSALLDDPFRLARLEGEESGRLEEEVQALSLTGGRRVVWVNNVTESLLGPLERVMKAESDTLIILEMPRASAKSGLRNFADKHRQIASIGCYPQEGRALEQMISGALAAEQILIEKDALGWLAVHLGADRLLVRSELEKLCLYAMQKEGASSRRLSLEDVRLCVGDSGGSSVEDAVYAALAGHHAEADQAFERAVRDGVNAIAILRTVLAVLGRLAQAGLLVENGKSYKEAMESLRPPVFFKRQGDFLRALSRWPVKSVMAAADETQLLEYACKQTSTPDILLCWRHMARLCRR